MARWIKANGEETEVHPHEGGEFTLEEMHAFVGGYLEAIKLTNTDVMYLNEDGLGLGLPVNALATQVLYKHRQEHAVKHTIIVGDVIIASLQETGDA